MLKKICFLLTASLFISHNIYSQVDLKNIEFSGYIYENESGIKRAIADVAVTDGYNIVTTDNEGFYKIISNATVKFVYITLPSGYDIPMNNNSPSFYKRITDKESEKQIIDFVLKKSELNDYKHVTIVWADPQVYTNENVDECLIAANDVKNYLKSHYAGITAHGIVCGDMVGDRHELIEPLKSVIINTSIPFFYLPGNHDMDMYGRSDETSRQTYNEHYGPDYYSFNRGKIHYIILSNVFYTSRGYLYIGYLSEQKLEWLEQDLALVPEGSTVVVSFHMPTQTKEYIKDSVTSTLQNRDQFYRLLNPYNAHIFSGHTHTNDNFIIGDNLYEHNHAAICGIFWQGPDCSDGTPPGYGVYEADGDQLTWHYKAIGFSNDYQFRVYAAGENPEKPEDVTVLVWNYDPEWSVRLYENGVDMGEMTQYIGKDPKTTDYIIKNKKNFAYDWIWTSDSDHMFYARPSSPDSKIKIKVTDRFGNIYTQDIRNDE